jgi:hypothetical protein
MAMARVGRAIEGGGGGGGDGGGEAESENLATPSGEDGSAPFLSSAPLSPTGVLEDGFLSPEATVMIELTKKLIAMDPEQTTKLEAFIRSQKLHDYLARCLDIGQLVNGVTSAEHPITAIDLMAWVRPSSFSSCTCGVRVGCTYLCVCRVLALEPLAYYDSSPRPLRPSTV